MDMFRVFRLDDLEIDPTTLWSTVKLLADRSKRYKCYFVFLKRKDLNISTNKFEVMELLSQVFHTRNVKKATQTKTTRLCILMIHSFIEKV
jgi:hypothetical protein